MSGDIVPGMYDMFSIFFVCAHEEFVIERAVVTLTDILSQLGGFSSIVIVMTKVIASMYNNALFERKLINKLFRVYDQT